MRRAVIYFSLTDNTKGAAEIIARELESDIYRISMKKSLPSSKGLQMMIGGMQSLFSKKPEVIGIPDSIYEYDEIILGLPIWASLPASPINTVVADAKLADKIKAVFTFSGGGDNEKCIERLIKKLTNMKYAVALADRNNSLSSENDKKLKKFMEQIKNG